jgi:hypothetical protein
MIYAFHRFGWASGGVSVSIFWGIGISRAFLTFSTMLELVFASVRTLIYDHLHIIGVGADCS